MKAVILTNDAGELPTEIKALAVFRENSKADAAVAALNALFSASEAAHGNPVAGLVTDQNVRFASVRCNGTVDTGDVIEATASIYAEVPAEE